MPTPASHLQYLTYLLASEKDSLLKIRQNESMGEIGKKLMKSKRETIKNLKSEIKKIRKTVYFFKHNFYSNYLFIGITIYT